MTASHVMINFEEVSYSYEGSSRKRKSLTNINFTINRGECIVLCGSSGCGKTTLTRLINGLIPHHYEGELAGKVSVDGIDIAEQALTKTSRTVGSVFQNPRSQFFNVDTTCELAFGCENQALAVEEIRSRLHEVDELFNLKGLMNRSIFELSGGEKQRIACASVYATHPDVVVLDEPSSNLDAPSIEKLRTTIGLLKSQGKTIVVSEHRLYYLADLADRFFYLKEGRVDGIFTSQEMHAFSHQTRASMNLRELDLRDISSHELQPKNPAKSHVPLLAFNNVVCRHKRKIALGLNELEISGGGVIAVIGHNGAGKSTFAHCLCGLQKHKGSILIDDIQSSPKHRVSKSYLVMQDVNHQLFTESVLDEVSLNAPQISDERITTLLEKLGLADYKNTHPLALSGGQKQRVSIASALLSGKKFLVYDEPTSGLDYHNMHATCHVIKEAAKEADLSLVITHDLEFILTCCTSVIHVSKGAILDHYDLNLEGINKVKQHFLIA